MRLSSSIARSFARQQCLSGRTRSFPSHAIRPFSSTPRTSLKEDADRSPEEIESKKQEQLQKQKEGKGEWHESLASGGESNVKADRQEVDDHGKHMEDLQEMGKKKGEKGEL